MKENLKYGKQTKNLLETNQKSEEILHAYLIFCVFGDTFYCDVVKGNVHVFVGCTKTQDPGIGTVLHR